MFAKHSITLLLLCGLVLLGKGHKEACLKVPGFGAPTGPLKALLNNMHADLGKGSPCGLELVYQRCKFDEVYVFIFRLTARDSEQFLAYEFDAKKQLIKSFALSPDLAQIAIFLRMPKPDIEEFACEDLKEQFSGFKAANQQKAISKRNNQFPHYVVGQGK